FDKLEPASQQFWQDINARYDQYQHDVQRPILPPQDLFIATNELFAKLKEFAQIEISEHGTCDFKTHAISPMPIEPRQE
ncbi:MAG TPA: hypothetical protein PLD88_02400, partial [Candidatus Berkiella sp.]|nr:hypothetical protein [Candidatus Berkiella sp.]